MILEKDVAKIKKVAKDFNIDVMGIFGSRARGDNDINSDYDIFIISDMSLDEELLLEEKLALELDKDVDLIKLTDELDKRIAKNIINEGIIIINENDKYDKFYYEIERFYIENRDFIKKRERDLVD